LNKPETTQPTYFHHLRDGTLIGALGRKPQKLLRSFGMTTRDLKTLRAWLPSLILHGCRGSPAFCVELPSSVGCQVADPKMESALAYLAVHATLAEASRCKFRSGLQ